MIKGSLVKIFLKQLKYTCLFFTGIYFSPLNGQSQVNLVKKITPSDRQSRDQLGWDIDSDTNFLIAGITSGSYFKDNKKINNTGAVYIYKIEGSDLNLSQKLYAPNPKSGSSFGCSVAIHKDVLVVGSQRYKTSEQSDYQTEGGVYIFRLINDLWQFEQFFVNPNKENENRGRFGVNVDVFDDYIIADDGLFNSSLSLIKYEYGKWGITDMILDKDTTFGCDAAIYGKTIAIGSKNYTNKNGIIEQKGKVFLYSINEEDKLKLEKTITPKTGNKVDIGFGSEVDLYNDVLLVGAETSEPLNKSGSLYLYNIDRKDYSIALDTLFTGDLPLKEDWFGHSFDISNNILLIGAMGNTLYNDQLPTLETEYYGSVYIYEKNGQKWNLMDKKHSTNPTIYDKFGFSVTICESNIFVGCRFDDEDENEENYLKNAGAIYHYRISE